MFAATYLIGIGQGSGMCLISGELFTQGSFVVVAEG